MTYKEFFKGKKVAVVGLGPHMDMLPDIKFLLKMGTKAEQNAGLVPSVAVYDMRSEKIIKHALAELIESGLKKYSSDLGVFADELAEADIIILSPDVPADASFLEKAYAKKVSVDFPQTLMLKLAPPITLIGVMGACGKSTVAHVTYAILKKAFSDEAEESRARVYHIDPDAPSALSILKTVKKDDLIVARIPASMIPAYHHARISPHISVFTTFSSWPQARMAELVSSILEFQTYNNFVIGNDLVIDQIREDAGIKPKAKMLRTHTTNVPAEWPVKYTRSYERENAALAVQVAELFKVPLEIMKFVLVAWSGLEGRLSLVKKVAGIEFYNDTCAISPTATLAALRTVSQNKNVTLIFGGAATGDSYDELLDSISQYAASVVLVPGSGTIGIRHDLAQISNMPLFSAHSIEDAVKIAREHATKGEAVLLSPGFEACGIDVSRRTRGEKFVKAVRAL
jgi:UDP-N-acetylmuramoylalanine--D-glutamate ligase